jgi:uncharacterized protein YjbJ (UPF0337 family)
MEETMISQQELKGHWQQIRGKVKEKWGQLTDNDLMQAEGNLDEFIGRVHQKTGETRKSIEEFLETSMAAAAPMYQKAMDNASAAAQKVASSVQDTYANAEQAVKQGYASTEKVVRENYKAAEKQVQERPVESMAAVFGIGAMLGAMTVLLFHFSSDRS